MKKIAMIMVALMAMVQVAVAHPRGKVAHKQYNQHHRIQQGVRHGQLTAREAHVLRMQQAKVRHYKQMAMADGRVTARERHLIDRTQRNASRNIYNQKHDMQRRGYR